MSMWTCIALIFIACISGAVVLVIFGHPWFALALLVICGSVSVKNGKEDE